MGKLSTFIIIHEGRDFAPARIVAEGLLLGRASDCELRLTDPSIPLALGGIKEEQGRFLFVQHQPSFFGKRQPHQVLINGRKAKRQEVLTSGDALVVGGYQLLIIEDDDKLVLKVISPDSTLVPLPSQAGAMTTGESAVVPGETTPSSADDIDAEETSSLVREWLERRTWKVQNKHPSETFLEPVQELPGFNWTPTRDLTPSWPVAFLLYCALLIAGAAVLVFFFWPSFYSPGDISTAHKSNQLLLTPAIAALPNGNSCFSCHSLRKPMTGNCEHCHQASGFQAAVTKEHQAAGITCVDCHSEHQGNSFSAKAAATVQCTSCHNDKNKKTFNGKSVGTPHRGTFGYPMANGEWKWKGLDEQGLRAMSKIELTRLCTDTEMLWRSKQFHRIHVDRVKTVQGMKGAENGLLSCSSCHEGFNPIDRETPRQTCSKCHGGYFEGSTRQWLVDEGKPNCVSCHVQHYSDTYRWGNLLTESTQENRLQAVGKNFVDAVTSTVLP